MNRFMELGLGLSPTQAEKPHNDEALKSLLSAPSPVVSASAISAKPSQPDPTSPPADAPSPALVAALEEQLISLMGFQQLPGEVKTALRSWIRTEAPTLAKLPEKEIRIALGMAQNVINQVLRSPRSFARKAQEAQQVGMVGGCSCENDGRCNNVNCPNMLAKHEKAKLKRAKKRVKLISEGL